MSTKPAAPTLPPVAKPAGVPPSLPGAKAALPGPGGPLPPGAAPSPKQTVETIKANSDGLRGNLVEELARDTTHFTEAEKQLIKFHGLYQQDNRDSRSGGRTYSFMVRSRVPGGKLTAAQYLAHDAIADEFANGTLRITTRQGFQFHGIVKGDLKSTMQRLNAAFVTTLAACGDVVRNVVCSPSPVKSALQEEIDAATYRLTDHFLPRTRAYHEVWLDGELAYDGKEHVETIEPIYGKTYLPRKFKIAVSAPGDNSIDIYTQDVGLIAVADGDRLAGFNVVVGGGLGMTHKKADTYPRLADPLAFVTVDELLPVVEEVVKVQRDHGDRSDRKHSRLKYLVAEWGIERFRQEVEQRLGYRLKESVPTPPLNLNLYLGWTEQGDGRWALGLSIENGRVADFETIRLKTGLREIVARFGTNIRLTTNHDLLLTDIRPEDRDAVEAVLREHGIPLPEEVSTARKYAMACPAMPTCPLAIAEAERVLPSVIDELETELTALGLADEEISVRMTGCPNGCARPYVADVGLVGRSLDRYTVFLGGRTDGTRLNEVYRDLVPLSEIVSTLRPVFSLFTRERTGAETFGDFCHRVGIEALQAATLSNEAVNA